MTITTTRPAGPAQTPAAPRNTQPEEIVARQVRIGVKIVLGVVALFLAGCASTPDARYVYQDGDFGVVAIPKNTPDGSNRYRKQADRLMARHFPKGYEIVRAEEVVQGTKTFTLGKTGSTELAPQSSSRLLSHWKVAGSLTKSEANTASVTECRIIYKKAGHSPSAGAAGGFAAEASLAPTCYLDPNSEARKQAKDPVKGATEKKDLDVAQTLVAGNPRARE